MNKAVWVILNVVDAFATVMALRLSALEINPIMALVVNTSPVLFVIAKVILAVGAIGILYLLHKAYLLKILNWLMLAVVGINAVTVIILI